MRNSFNARSTLAAAGADYQIFRLDAVPGSARLPYSLKILLENLLRHEDGVSVTAEHIRYLAQWDPAGTPECEISFRPARVLMQDFTGVPAVVDLAAMRDAMRQLGGDPQKINPLQPAELVIDHSVQVDLAGSRDAFAHNEALEYQRNRERYSFLKWGQQAFSNFRVVPPETGIVHQVNLEYLARVVFTRRQPDGTLLACPDTVVGTDSHTTMINGLGVLGWGVGGIEAEAAMLGQPVSMLIPQVIGVRLDGRLPEGTTATDLVLTVVERLRSYGVVGKFVEFFGSGLDHLPLADRATIANMAPEYGATCGIFPIDGEALEYLRLTGRSEQQLALIESYAREQGLFRDPAAPPADYSDVIPIDLGAIEPCLAGPHRPQDRIPLRGAKPAIRATIDALLEKNGLLPRESAEIDRFSDEGGHTAVGVEQQGAHRGQVEVNHNGQRFYLNDGMVVIAAITSCTNTSNPSVMLGAALLARNARRKGLTVKPWVKSSLGPGSRVVTHYLERSGLLEELEGLGFHVVGYGCTTCIGNSGPLAEPISAAIRADDLAVCAVLSGNRNFEGRIHSEVQMNYLASPPLVVAYAIAGRMDIDLYNEPLGHDQQGKPVYLREIWPDNAEVHRAVAASLSPEGFSSIYADVNRGDRRWLELEAPSGELFDWSPDSTYIQNPPYFHDMARRPAPVADIQGARVLALLGDSVTTDHISPAGAIKPDSPAGRYLRERGVAPADFNSYGSRRGNHEVMMRGTFANIRLRNLLAPGTEGGITRYQPDGELMPIYDAAMRYREAGVPLIVIAGREYGSGSSRDWAAKGPRLLGVRAVIAESYERIHRSNLVGMGILPLQFVKGENAGSLGLDGSESYTITGLGDGTAKRVTVTARRDDWRCSFQAQVRIDTPQEVEYYRHGGILHYVLRQLA